MAVDLTAADVWGSSEDAIEQATALADAIASITQAAGTHAERSLG